MISWHEMTIPDGVHHHVRTFHYSLHPSHTSVKNGSVAFVGSALSVTINSFLQKAKNTICHTKQICNFVLSTQNK